ncbi:ankyrin [Fusarium circinatum]|uniref:Ankyrin n=1 Tax=Fusarium circinatum TaxID=48490 RepID=A0A8H5TK67_FUSCI|nr:ankyrin [Fusarium circinatum]
MLVRHPLEKIPLHQLLLRLFPPWSHYTTTSLHEAAKLGDEHAVRRAIKAGVDLNQLDENGRSALQLAASSGCSSIFAILLQAGASVGILVPPPSLIDVCVILYRLLDTSFAIIIYGWLASKVHIPVPRFILQIVWTNIVLHLIVLFILHFGTIALFYRYYPATFANSKSIIKSIQTFMGDTEQPLTLFLDSNPELSFEEQLVIWSQAVDRGYSGVCQRLLRQGFPVDFVYCHDEFPDCFTALLHACGACHADLTQLLLSNGADPTLLDNHGRSCILLAADRPFCDHAGPWDESDRIIQILQATDAVKHINTTQNNTGSDTTDPSLPGRLGWPLGDASQGLRIEAVRTLLLAGADPRLKTESGWTALHAACRWHVSDAVDVVRLLVQFGADVNAVSENGWTPLGCAASMGSFLEIIKILVQAGANIESTAGEMTTALQIAARHDISGGKVVKYLAEKGANVNATGGTFGSVLLATLERSVSVSEDGTISLSVDDQQIEFLSVFLQHGMDVNMIPEGHPYPLQVAAETGLARVLSFLISHGARIPLFKDKSPQRRSGDVFQKSLLSFVSPGYPETFAVLLSAGVSADTDGFDQATGSHTTLLSLACSRNDTEYLETAILLLKHGADPNLPDYAGHVPVQRAAYALSLKHLQKLTEYGAEMKIGDRDQWGSLFHSVCKGASTSSVTSATRNFFLECFGFLVQRLTLDLAWEKDGDGKNCLHYLAELAEETRLVAKVDGSFSCSESSLVPILGEFLQISCPPNSRGQSSDSSLGLFFLTDNNGRLPIHTLAQKGDVQALFFLLSYITTAARTAGMDLAAAQSIVSFILSTCDNRGWSCLHFAASEGRAFGSEALLEASDLSLLILTKESVVDLANEKQHYKTADYINAFIEGRFNNDGALVQRAQNMLRSAVNDTLAYEFTEDQLMDAIRLEGELHAGRSEG